VSSPLPLFLSSERVRARRKAITPRPDPRTIAGIQPGHSLTTINGDYNANTSISDLNITGNLIVYGDNMTVSNVQVGGDISIGNNYGAGGWVTNVTLSHVDCQSILTFGFDTLTVDQTKVHGATNKTMSQFFDYSYNGVGTLTTSIARKLVLTNCWFYGFGSWSNAAHAECIHTSGIQGAVFFNNYFDATVPDVNTLQYVSANFFMEPQLYVTYDKDFLICSNTFVNGGFYLASIEPTGKSWVCNNTFLSDANDPNFIGGAAGVNTDPKTSNRAPAGGFPAFYQNGNTLNGVPITMANGVGGLPDSAPGECS